MDEQTQADERRTDERRAAEADERQALAAALVRAQASVMAVAKDARHDYHRYQYVSADQMVATCGPALAAAGLSLSRIRAEIGERFGVAVPQKSGSARDTPCIMVHSTFQLQHASGGTMLIEHALPAVIEAGRTPDKAILAAQTESLSYVLRDLLLVARGDETVLDASGRVDQPPPPNARTPSSGQRQPPPGDPAEQIRKLVASSFDVDTATAEAAISAAFDGSPNLGGGAWQAATPDALRGLLAYIQTTEGFQRIKSHIGGR